MIPLYKVHMPKNIAQVLEPVLLSGFVSEGPRAKKFELEFQRYIGNPNTALVNSGTSALTLALRLVGVGPGTSVISTPMTCLATNTAVLSLGGDITWCDIDPVSGNMDADKIEQLITPKTKAILFVDWGGTPAELDKINAVANKYGLKTIEDAAQALGSSFDGIGVGNKCDFSCFSFQAIKHLTTCDGGALACRTREDYDRAILLRWFGLSRSHNKKSPVCWEGDVPEHGYKMHMNDVNATIGLEQLKYVDNIIDTHKRNGKFLLENLKDVPGIEVYDMPDYIDSSYWFFTIKLDSSTHRAQVCEKLAARGISSAITHTRNDAYSLFNKYGTHLPGVDDFDSRKLNIPCGWWCSQKDMEYIVDTLKKVC